MLERLTFTIDPADPGSFICADIAGEAQPYICAHGLREWFDVPKRATEFDLLLSDEPSDHSYCVKFEHTSSGELSPSPRYFYGESRSVFFAPILSCELSSILREFRLLHSTCHLAVEV